MKTKTLIMCIILLTAPFHVNSADHYSPIRLWQQCMFKEMTDFVASDEILGKSKIKDQIYDYLRSAKQVPWTSDVYCSLLDEIGHEASQAAGAMALFCGSELDYNAA